MYASSITRAGCCCCTLVVFLLGAFVIVAQAPQQHSVARKWNDALLTAIRNDLARPPVHARNLFHVSAAMWDAWAAYATDNTKQWLHQEKRGTIGDDVARAREATMSYAAYRILVHRFANSVGVNVTMAVFSELMEELGLDSSYNSTSEDTPFALGNRIAHTYIQFGLQDGSNEPNDYANRFYYTINPRLVPTRVGNRGIFDPDRWQPLFLDEFVDQSGNVVATGVPPFQSPEWGGVTPFALTEEDKSVYSREDNEYWVFHDPGPPPLLSSPTDSKLYKAGFEQVLLWSGLLDPASGEMIDISPRSIGNNTLGTNDGNGYAFNPNTQQQYTPQVVPAGDYYRVLAEFWADGPDSETPPGHWFAIANEVSYHPQFIRRMEGNGPLLDPLEWDVKLYFALGGAMHDAAIAAWSTKGWYDYVRPISAIRYMAGLGQSTIPDIPSYHPDGINLYPGAVELITNETILPGERHEHLYWFVGRVAAKAWKGPSYIDNAETDTAGVGWILVENWWPYQRPSFVTPPFAAYVSGHSTFSRAAARVLTDLTGDPFFPGGMAEFHAEQNEFLVFEEGPSVNITLQWARYFDAADECSLSRIYGGIHPTADDIPGRFMGDKVGSQATKTALTYFNGQPLAGSVHGRRCWNRNSQGKTCQFVRQTTSCSTNCIKNGNSTGFSR